MKRFSLPITIFHGNMPPEDNCLSVGYMALINVYDLKVPLPDTCSLIGPHHKNYKTPLWNVYTPRYEPEDSLAGQLTFALKYEGVDLGILKSLFQTINPEEIAAWVLKEPTGKYSRRIWFFYEWLIEKKLNIENAKFGNFVDAIDSKLQYQGPSKSSTRHRINNNLPGNQKFCPLVRRTDKLEKYIESKLNIFACEKLQQTQKDLVTRATAFLTLKDSRASFQIEREQPDQRRAERWGQAIGQAGTSPLSEEEFLRLQKIILEKNRFITLGFRNEGGFIGTHDPVTGAPIPDHISARWQDIPALIDGMINTYQHLKKRNAEKESFDSVIFAAMIAFGFVFIHPFADGNGRIHRYIIHQILAETGFIPKRIVVPISAVILEHIDKYKQALEHYSKPRLEFINWNPTDKGNIEILNQTIDLYSYFDATAQAEFLYDCVHQALTDSLPKEIDYLERYDSMKAIVKEKFSMPDHLISLLIHFLEQNNGLLSKRARMSEFAMLSNDECQQLEAIYAKCFKMFIF